VLALKLAKLGLFLIKKKVDREWHYRENYWLHTDAVVAHSGTGNGCCPAGCGHCSADMGPGIGSHPLTEK
jgi:hypothetical protein